MTVNAAIDAAFEAHNVSTLAFRTDEQASVRIGSTPRAVVQISDHRQGRGQNVPLRDADPRALDVTVITKRQIAKAEGITVASLTKTLGSLLKGVTPTPGTYDWYFS